MIELIHTDSTSTKISEVGLLCSIALDARRSWARPIPRDICVTGKAVIYVTCRFTCIIFYNIITTVGDFNYTYTDVLSICTTIYI